MKRLFLVLSILAVCYCSFAQTNTFPSSGNVGIGTTSPAKKLVVQGTDNDIAVGILNSAVNDMAGIGYNNLGSHNNGITLFATNTQNPGLTAWDNGEVAIGQSYSYNQDSNGANPNGLIVQGNVGVGTTTPETLLEVTNPSFLGTLDNTNTNLLTLFGNINGNGSSASMKVETEQALGEVRVQHIQGLQGRMKFMISNGGNDESDLVDVMNILYNGNVGIGTTTPDATLAVNGTVHAKEVKVDLIGWPDYVFKLKYKLPSLTTVKAYIDKNRRLPDMPSEKEVSDNGINLGEMIKVQTKKIEELTLYLIEKDKQLADQQKQLTDQQKINQSLQEQINRLAKQIEH